MTWELNGVGNKCRFDKNDLFNFETTESKDCSRICSNIERCTHFTWSKNKCFLKYGVIRKLDAKTDNEFACGIVDHIETLGNLKFFNIHFYIIKIFKFKHKKKADTQIVYKK